MSQAGSNNNGGGTPPPQVPIQFTTDFQSDLITPSGIAIPQLNNLNVKGGPGISTYVNPDNGPNLFIKLENGCEDTTTTTNAVPKDIICITLDPFPSTTMVESRVIGFVADTPNQGLGVAYFLTAGVRTDGTTAAIIQTPDKLLFEDAAITACDATLDVSGNNVIVRVTGLVGTTIKWREVTNATIVANNFP